MRKDCKLWTNTCISWQKSTVPRHVHSLLGSFLQPTEKFLHIHVNLIGPLPIIDSYKYCLTIIDRFTFVSNDLILVKILSIHDPDSGFETDDYVIVWKAGM